MYKYIFLTIFQELKKQEDLVDAQAERVRNERIEMEEEKKKDAVPPPQEKPDHIREADHIRGNFFMKHIENFAIINLFVLISIFQVITSAVNIRFHNVRIYSSTSHYHVGICKNTCAEVLLTCSRIMAVSV